MEGAVVDISIIQIRKILKETNSADKFKRWTWNSGRNALIRVSHNPFQERFGDSTSWLLLLHDDKNDPTLNIWHLKLICLLFQPHVSWDSPVSRHICQPATDPRSHVEEVPKVKKAIKFQPQPLSKPRPTLIPDCWNLAHIQQSLFDLAKRAKLQSWEISSFK